MSQALATVVALFLAVPGVLFAISTYNDQQELIRDQQILNRIAVERNDRRYASRVTFWDAGSYTNKPDKRREVTLVKVRNMTPLPITDVVLLGAASIRGNLPSPRSETDGEAGYRPLVRVKTLGPCHEMEVWVERGDLYGAWRRMLRPHVRELDIADVPNWVSARMYFVVAGQNWEETTRSLEPRSARVYDGVRSPADLAAASIGDEAWAEPKPIPDCGEGD